MAWSCAKRGRGHANCIRRRLRSRDRVSSNEGEYRQISWPAGKGGSKTRAFVAVQSRRLDDVAKSSYAIELGASACATRTCDGHRLQQYARYGTKGPTRLKESSVFAAYTLNMISISIIELSQLTQMQLVLLFLGRCCSCAIDKCDICTRRCPLTLNDGNELWYPVLANDGQLYDARELVRYTKYAEWRGAAIASPVYGNDILSVNIVERNTMVRSAALRACACLHKVIEKRSWSTRRKNCVVNRGTQTDPTPPCNCPVAPFHRHHPRELRHLPRAVRAIVGGAA